MLNFGDTFRLTKRFFKTKIGIYLTAISMALLDILVIFWVMQTYDMIKFIFIRPQ